ncbi:MAG: DUF3267 domain-containing protein [Peptococcaceae bacterium]|nr:DUF3267 domain-containing protein [Peptococcaceae bacterium]
MSCLPSREYKRILVLSIPWWIKVITTITGIIVAVFVLRQGLSVQELLFTLLVMILIMIINRYLHEKCHAWTFQILTGNPTEIRLNSLSQPFCRMLTPCPVRPYIIGTLAPLAVVTALGFGCSLSYLTKSHVSITTGLAITTILTLSGMAADILWAWRLRNVPPESVVIDHGISAEVYIHKPKEYS